MPQKDFITQKSLQAVNSTSGATANLSPELLALGNLSVNTTVLSLGANLRVNTSAIFIGNASVNCLVNSSSIKVTAILANGILGSAGQFLTSNSTGGLFWSTSTVSAPGSDGQVIINSGGALGTNAEFTYDQTNKTLGIGNTTVNAFANTLLIKLANSTSIANMTSGGFVAGIVVHSNTQLLVGANVIANSSALYVGNSTVNAIVTQTLVTLANSAASANHSCGGFQVGTTNVISTGVVCGANVSLDTVDLQFGNTTVNALANSIMIQFANATATANLFCGGLQVGTTLVNSSVVSVGSNVVITVSDIQIGNSTVNTYANSTLLKVQNATASANLNPAGLIVGTSVLNSTAIALGSVTLNTTALLVGTSVVNATTFAAGAATLNSTALSVGALSVNTTTAQVGFAIINTTAYIIGSNIFLSTDQLLVGNSTVNTTAVKTTRHVFSGTMSANGGVGSAGQFLTSAGAGNSYWSTVNPSVFDSGTAMLFVQAAAPTGWTKSVTHNDKALRIVSGTGGGNGGSRSFSSVFGMTATDGHALTINEMPNHAHTANAYTTSGSVKTIQNGGQIGAVSVNTGAIGGDQEHAHDIDMRVRYVDAIICTKD